MLIHVDVFPCDHRMITPSGWIVNPIELLDELVFFVSLSVMDGSDVVLSTDLLCFSVMEILQLLLYSVI